MIRTFFKNLLNDFWKMFGSLRFFFTLQYIKNRTKVFVTEATQFCVTHNSVSRRAPHWYKSVQSREANQKKLKKPNRHFFILEINLYAKSIHILLNHKIGFEKHLKADYLCLARHLALLYDVFTYISAVFLSTLLS